MSSNKRISEFLIVYKSGSLHYQLITMDLPARINILIDEVLVNL